MMQFIGYSGATNLQSSINPEAGLGTASLAAVYVGLLLSNIFLPMIVIKWIGAKWTISLSFILYMPYIAAQLYPTFYTLIPTAFVLGVGGGPLWCSKCTYLAVVSEVYSQLISNVTQEALLTRFLGIFFMVFQLNQIWGNLISSLVLTSGNNEAAVTAVNASLIPTICGANFLPNADAMDALQKQPEEKIQLMSGIYLGCMALASLIVAVGVDSMKRYEAVRQKSGTGSLSFAMLGNTLKLLAEPNLLMLVTITVFFGMEQAFFGADFTAAFVSCVIGTGSVGFIVMAWGLSGAFGSVFFGYLVKKTGRLAIMSGVAIVHAAMFITLLVWPPYANALTELYIIAVFWGLCDSIWMVQISAYYGSLFCGREEAAFANFKLWESVGYIIAYVISPYFRTSTKTYFTFACMILGIVQYYIVEYRDRKAKKFLKKTPDCTVNGKDNVRLHHSD